MTTPTQAQINYRPCKRCTGMGRFYQVSKEWQLGENEPQTFPMIVPCPNCGGTGLNDRALKDQP